jgi:hypothetical protein
LEGEHFSKCKRSPVVKIAEKISKVVPSKNLEILHQKEKRIRRGGETTTSIRYVVESDLDH